MASGFKSKSTQTDLDAVFEPYAAGTKAISSPFKHRDSGQNMSDRYAPRNLGGEAAATGFRLSDGRDLNQIYAKIGTVGYLAAASWPGTGMIIQAAAAGTAYVPPAAPGIRDPGTWQAAGVKGWIAGSYT